MATDKFQEDPGLGQSTSTGDAAALIQATSMKMPTSFWHEDPENWFGVVEAQFATKGITQPSTKFYHVVSALDQKTAKVCSDLIRSPPSPPADMYNELRSRLISTYGLTDEERAAQILQPDGLGDRKPSDLARELLWLVQSNRVSFLLRFIFLMQLPPECRGPLSAGKYEDLLDMAKDADKIWQSTCNLPRHVNQAEDIVQSVNAANQPMRPWFSTSGLCYYHYTFKAKARKCKTGCTWKPNDSKNV